MRLNKSLFLLFFAGCFSLESGAQGMHEDEGVFITQTIDAYLSKYDYVHDKPRKSEFILVLLTIDNVGLVSEISFLSDEKNRDTIYSIVSKITPEAFRSKRILSCKGEMVLVPICSIASDFSSSYVSKLNINREGIRLRSRGIIIGRFYLYEFPKY